MWYRYFLFRYADVGDEVPDKVCPICHNKLIEREGKFGKFWGCSGYPSCKYLYNPDKPSASATPPVSQEEAELEQLLYCPVCARKGIQRLVVKRKSKKTGEPFYGCTSWTPSNSGCGYVSFKYGEPITEEEIKKISEYKSKQIIDKIVKQTSEEDAREVPEKPELIKSPIDYFREMPVVTGGPNDCPFGHGVLKTSKSGGKYCPRCSSIIRKHDGNGTGYQASISPTVTFIVFDTLSNDSLKVINGQVQKTISEELESENFNIGSSYLQHISSDAKIYKDANSSEENDPGQGDIIQGSLRIMSPEAKDAIQLDTDGFISGIDKQQKLMTDTFVDYLDLQEYIDRGDIYQAGTIGGKIIMVSDGGIRDEEKCQEATKSDIYKYSEIGAKGLIPNPSQASALELIEDPESRNLVLCLPTGVGKTTIAEWAIADSKRRAKLLGRKSSISVYVCPARALAAQIARDFSHEDHPFVKENWKTSILRGIGNDSNDDEQYMLQQKGKISQEDEYVSKDAEEWKNKLESDPNNSDIIVITPEKLLACLQQPATNPWIGRITTMIFDEGHLIGDSSRGPNFETEQIQIYEKFKKIRDMLGGAARIVYMSATMQNAVELVAWQQAMSKRDLALVTKTEADKEREANWALVRGEWTPVKIDVNFIPSSFEQDSTEDHEKVLSDLVSASNQIKNKDGEIVMRPSLIFVQSYADGRTIAQIAKNYYWKCKECGFVQYGLTGPGGKVLDPKEAPAYQCPKCGKQGTMEGWSIPFHNAQLSSLEQTEIVDKFNNDYINNPVLIATSTLAAGVNTGAYRVCIFNTSRGGRDIETSQLIQEMGRAGRQKYLSEFPDSTPQVFVYSPKDSIVHDQRRLYSKSVLKSKLCKQTKITDSILRAISIMGIQNAEDCGNYIASTFSYYQNQVDFIDPMNIRRGLEHISSSYNKAEGIDNVIWESQGRASEYNAVKCYHTNLIDTTRLKNFPQKQIIDTQNGPEMVDLDYTDSSGNVIEGEKMFSCICKTPLKNADGEIITDSMGNPITCGAYGYIKQVSEPVKPEQFLEYIDNSIRDLIASGMIVQEDDKYKITSLGRQIISSSMSVSDAVDIIKNMDHLKFDVNTANNWTYAIAFGSLRKYNDEDESFLTKDQSVACSQAFDIATKLGLSPDYNVKQIQCLYWILSGINPKTEDPETKEKIIPRCMASEYSSTLDDFKGIFLVGLSVLSSRAQWFGDAPEEFERLRVKLENSSSYGSVTDEMVPLVAVKGIGVFRAKKLLDVGIINLLDLIKIDTQELADRFVADKKIKNPKKEVNPIFELKEAKFLKRLATDAMSGEQVEKDINFRNKSKPFKMQYLNTVRLLNTPEIADKMFERSKLNRPESHISFDPEMDKTASVGGWYQYFLNK